jgi:hypothetical protein
MTVREAFPQWLRRNRWFLLALVLLVPAAFVVSLIPRYFPYLETQPVAIDVPLGEVVRYSGADVQLTDLEVLDGTAWNAPAGADVVVATFSIDVVDPPEVANCAITVVAPIDGVEREWNEASDVGDYDVPDYFETYCDLSEVGRYHLQVTFVVPHGEVPDPTIVLSSWAAAPQVLRLS